MLQSSNRRLGRILSAALGLTLLLVSEGSYACGACFCDTPFGLRPVADNIALVPLNARFLVELADFDPDGNKVSLAPSEVQWTNLDDMEPVPFEVIETAGTAGQVWIAPTQVLPEATNFRLEVSGTSVSPAFSATFRTGGSVDISAPFAPQPRVELKDASGACGEFDGVVLVWDEIQDDGTAVTYDPVVEVEVQSGVDSVILFQDARLFEGGKKGVQLAAPNDEAGSACWRSSALPFGMSGEQLTVTVSIYDRAGNKTRLEPLTLELGHLPGATCPSAQGDCTVAAGYTDSRWAAAFGAMFGLWVLRRARATRA